MKISIKYVILLLVATIGVVFLLSKAVKSPPIKTVSPSDNNEVLVNISYQGGNCIGKVCSSQELIYSDGTVYTNQKTQQTKLPPAAIQHLKEVINTTDYNKERSVKFTGTCPIAYDGSEAIYTFTTSHGTESIASCSYEINRSSPVFKYTTQLLSEYKSNY